MRLRALLLGLVYTAAAHAAAWAEEPIAGGVPERISRLSDREVEQRLAFLQERLDAGRDYAWWWWHGWTAFYATGVVVESTEAGLADNSAKRADYIVGAVKAGGGTILLLSRPLEAKDGADAIRALPGASRADRRLQLVAAEERLRRNAEASNRRYSWQRHLTNVAVNTAGALIVWKGFGDATRAWRSAGIGVGVGETMLWSQPWRPAQDWEDYQHRFDGGADRRVSWHIGPTIGGVALQMNF